VAEKYDVMIVGSGPAGSVCAAICARNGLRTVLVERAIFPREKVCGDCINPNCWPILERLGVAARVRALPHAQLAEVEFIGLRGRSLKFSLGDSERGEIAVKRSAFDQVLLQSAAEFGVEVREGFAVTSITRDASLGYRVCTGEEMFSMQVLVAADGRNSTVARQFGLMPRAAKDRIALQTHFPLPKNLSRKVVMRLLPDGYCGLADVGGGEANLCLVARPGRIDSLKDWAVKKFALSPDQPWRTITPLSRKAITPSAENLYLVGDAARVVEPFTGEGIFYALASGELAGEHISAELKEHRPGFGWREYQRDHAALYRGRLWINEIAKHAVLHPRLGNIAFELARLNPRVLRFLTSKVVSEAIV
jgi:flavin-dependent dehydrogenase